MKRTLSALAVLSLAIASLTSPALAAAADAPQPAEPLECKADLVPCAKSSECCSSCCYTTITMGSYCTNDRSKC